MAIDKKDQYIDFEKPIIDLYNKIEELKRVSAETGVDMTGEIESLQKRVENLYKITMKDLTPYQRLQIARHPKRPSTLDFIKGIFDDYFEMKGDRLYRDDPSIIGGVARFSDLSVVFIGHQKGSDTKSNVYRNFGMPHPEGYRKAMRLMRHAQKFNLPLVTFIDTPGAYPGIEAEERGQSNAIAESICLMSSLSIPSLAIVIGEGGSGGALAISVADRIAMLENSVYSVISPEGCASILFRDAKFADEAAKALKMTSYDLLSLGIIDEIIEEPLGGAHRDIDLTIEKTKECIARNISNLLSLNEEERKAGKWNKYASIGKYTDLNS
ncbi:Acetyl-coenzyme A carboxylase carboxyl transferase subunit alpha [Thermodesulfobium narugense DSM 14796]|uniref:Acetyl-coenzyme A carboxylase carboxyl transferase subunit alpha n=1 Tax=Thermodesulfobium narugense DSM 14796 TaxID=747365 RepID=M1E6T6_9BACT|nr:acetyl-CoA carboxylase carboxyltransferase subunit alpha [Thermodesulfobium narugense]AEE14971.1 Acetyl-coenzyme A carboxylase carboxyl transferase subunit alpha [Thermodesulfobium narugense DSM 14796]